MKALAPAQAVRTLERIAREVASCSPLPVSRILVEQYSQTYWEAAQWVPVSVWRGVTTYEVDETGR